MQKTIPISNENNFCEGYFSSNSQGYILGVSISTSKAEKQFSHHGSSLLDKIFAYDLAEIQDTNLGQINMIQVSSFCGPRGLIWGYDICAVEKIPYIINNKGFKNINVYRLDDLARAFFTLTGSIEKPKFPFLPGSHVPCAVKYITKAEKSIIYATQAIGIAKNREKDACILMEDVGEIPLDANDLKNYNENIINNIVNSVVAISQNQKIHLAEIFVGLKSIFIDENEVGCAMVASPYFNLAKNAIPDSSSLFDIDLYQWTRLCDS